MTEAAEKARLEEIRFNKLQRNRLGNEITVLTSRSYQSEERILAFRAMQQARHWLGEDLAILGAQHPYPNGSDCSNTIVDPAADKAV